MKNKITQWILPIVLLLFSNHLWGQLTPACSPSYSNTGNSWRISEVNFGTFTHIPTWNVHDYTSQVINVDAGDTYSVSLISQGYCGVGIAADFNNDGDFDDPGEMLALPAYSANSPATYTTTVTIPPSVLTGEYRIRFYNRLANSGAGNPADSPCGNYGYGSWQDYTLNVTNNATCQPPSGLTIDDLTPTSIDFSWTASSTTPDNYFWKIVENGEDPDVVPGISGTTINLDASVATLSPTTDYQVYIRSVCGADESLWSLPLNFTTPCDGQPTAGASTSSAATVCATVNFTLTNTGAAAGPGIVYQWQSSPAGQNTWTDIAGATNTSLTTNQTDALDYRMIVTCTGSSLADTSNTVTVGMSPANQCYCTPTYTYGCGSDRIESFTLEGEGGTGINDLNTGCAPNAYDDKTNLFASLFIGQDYDAFISTNSNFSLNVRVWIDFNDNGAFESSETVALLTGVGTAGTTFTIEVPPTAVVGSYRMRVRLVYSTAATSIDPCNNQNWGETHDYTINLIEPSGCITPGNITLSNVSYSTASLSWTPSTLGDPWSSFNYELRTSGAPGSGAAGLESSDNNITNTFADFNNLVGGTTYYFYVQTNCTGTDTSAWSGAYQFTLPEYVPVDVSGFTADVIANGVGHANQSTDNDVDGANYALVAEDFKSSPTGPSPTKYLPNDRQIMNGTKWFTLADYSDNNSLRLGGAGQSGTLVFNDQVAAEEIYVLGVSGSGVSNITAEVWFNDNTSETFTALSFPDWFASTGNIVAPQVGRVNRNSNNLEAGTGPQLFEVVLNIATANEQKIVDSIVFNTVSPSNVMNIMAISIKPGIPFVCEEPTNFAVSNVTNNEATLDWTGVTGADEYEVSYGPTPTAPGAGTVITVSNATTLTLTNLLPATEYQAYVRTICGVNSISDWEGPVEFETLIAPQCTGVPTIGTLISPHTIVCAGTPDFDIVAQGASTDLNVEYAWFASPAGQNAWTNLNNNTTAYTVSGQLEATDYMFVITCTNSDLSDSAVIFIDQNLVEDCYCNPATTLNDAYISSFSTSTGMDNISNLNSGYSSNGYGTFTNMVVSHEIGGAIDFEIEFNTPGLTAKIWVDWNYDGVFDVSEEMFEGTVSGTVLTGNFTVPANAIEGSTRMRVAVNPNSNIFIDPCVTSGSGEYEDYTFLVLPPCVNPVVDLGDDIIICEGGTIVLDAGPDGYHYQWSTGQNTQTIEVGTAGTYSVTVINGLCEVSDQVNVSVIQPPTASHISATDNLNGSFTFQVISPQNVDSYLWDLGDGNTSTLQNPIHTYTENGAYYVELIITNDCTSDTLYLTVDVRSVGINDMVNNKSLLLYPNPAQNQLHFSMEDMTRVKAFSIINVLGQEMIFEDQLDVVEYNINTSLLNAGVYYIRLFTEDGMVIKSFEILK